MNLLFISGLYPPNNKGGGEVSTHLIARALAGAGHQITVITEGDETHGLLDNVRIIRQPLGLTRKPLFERVAAAKAAIELNRTIDFDSFDCVHAHDFRGGLVLSELVRAGIVPAHKAAVTIRDYAPISGDSTYILSDGTIPTEPMSIGASWRSYRVAEVSGVRKYGRFSQYALNVRYRAQAFAAIPNRIYISHQQRTELLKHLSGARHERVIFNPVPQEYLDTPTVPERTNTALYVGRVEEYKGVRLLLQAWQTVAKQIPAARLIITGTGAQLKKYQQLTKKFGMEQNVYFTGHVTHKEMQALYDETAVLVAPNLWLEPFGRAVAEAMARARVVVASKAGGPAELITHGITGYLCDRGSVTDLTEKLLEVLTQVPAEREHIGNAAREWVGRELTPQKISEQYEEFYKSM